MPIKISRNRDGTVAVAHCYGILTDADISASIRCAFSFGHFEPGVDRIVTISPEAELHDLDLEALRRIQRRVLDRETQSGREARFRSVLVHSSPMQENLMKLYMAIWETLGLPGVKFSVVASETEAWKILGFVPSATQSAGD